MRARASGRSTVPEIQEGDRDDAEPSNGAFSREQGFVQNPESATAVDNKIESPSLEPAESDLEPREDDEIHYLVSSRHLMLASPWFRRALTKEGFIEASKEPSDGRYHIAASDWDEKALLILLNIFHIRTRQVPQTVTLETLAKIAVLVDYYELQNAEVTERDVRDWIASVRRIYKVPSHYCRDLMLWICISRVFCMSKEFEEATLVAIKTSTGWIQTLDLPIHQEITSAIDSRRCNALEHIISKLHSLLEVYRDFNYSCPHNSSHSFHCGAFLYGALMKYMERWGCLSPRPERPFMGMSLDGICRRHGMSNKMAWWHKNSCMYDQEKFEAHPCRLDSKIDALIHNAMAQVKGLRLQDLPEMGRGSRLKVQ
ncbi:hypothetical protein DM02DRAFT_526231 [Periconia macrospinosa]|uniref:BTB domain-containing protein n=1 Tax=Periconia macrospinosa TaxID=97972 RepID=A0A2V1DRC5_9PLEO|nr:hypothetical protein DM02DRAFT_526231 [Periconia macrospinosa]